MKVVMVTPMVDEDHSIFGFIPIWINSLAKRVERLQVVTLAYEPETHLEENVSVYPIRTDTNIVGKFISFNGIMCRLLRKDTDVIFCHMVSKPTVYSALYAKLFRIPVVWWRAHGTVTLTARAAHFLVNRAISSSEISFGMRSRKLTIVGHGIDTEKFKPDIKETTDKPIVLSAGRISPIKDYGTLIKAANILVNERGMKDLEFVIAGGTAGEPEGYFEKLKRKIEESKLTDYIKFAGPIPYTKIEPYYQR